MRLKTPHRLFIYIYHNIITFFFLIYTPFKEQLILFYYGNYYYKFLIIDPHKIGLFKKKTKDFFLNKDG